MKLLKFKDFIQESVEIDPDSIKIDNPELYEFDFEGEHYKVEFERTDMIADIRGVMIGFKGPKGYMPTGFSREKAYRLYGIMLSAVIAYIKRYKPKGLYFSGATSAMDLLYKRFADRYAGEKPGKTADEVFIRVNSCEWVRKDVYENLKPQNKQTVNDSIAHWNNSEPEFIAEKRRKSAQRRQNFLKYNQFFGGFILNARNWFLITGVNDFGFDTYNENLQKEYVFSDEILYATLVSPNELNKVPKLVLQKFATSLSSFTAKTKIIPLLPKGCAERIIQAAGTTNEAVEIDTSKIDITNPNSYVFQFEGINYEVQFHLRSTTYTNNCVSISFYGPNGCSPTGISGTKSPQVYGIMLSAVIAYIEKYKPESLHFYGATNSMDLVYKRFADRYASDAPGKPADRVFIRIGGEDWIRKDVYESLPASEKRQIDFKIKDWKQYEPAYIQHKRQAGIDRRRAFMKMKPYFGGFALYKDLDIFDNQPFTEWHLLLGVNEYGDMKTIVLKNGRLTDDFLTISNSLFLVLPNELENKVPQDILQKFVEYLTRNPSMKNKMPPNSYERLVQAVKK